MQLEFCTLRTIILSQKNLDFVRTCQFHTHMSITKDKTCVMCTGLNEFVTLIGMSGGGALGAEAPRMHGSKKKRKRKRKERNKKEKRKKKERKEKKERNTERL